MAAGSQSLLTLPLRLQEASASALPVVLVILVSPAQGVEGLSPMTVTLALEAKCLTEQEPSLTVLTSS